MYDQAVRERWEQAARNRTTERQEALEAFGNLLDLMADLRSPAGCPWDNEQTLASLRQYVMEEAAEVCEAIDEVLKYEDRLRLEHELPTAEPAAPAEDDTARTDKKGKTIAHHPARGDFDPNQSASGAPVPDKLTSEEEEELRRRYRKLATEIGDLFLQPVFLTEIMLRLGRGSAADSITRIVAKLVNRHPHIYGGVKVKDSAEVLRNWEQIKSREADEN
jgi:uncharacterized protein YabN with tetrapyrrole methylase and pyrophosphatase domain